METLFRLPDSGAGRRRRSVFKTRSLERLLKQHGCRGSSAAGVQMKLMKRELLNTNEEQRHIKISTNALLQREL